MWAIIVSLGIQSGLGAVANESGQPSTPPAWPEGVVIDLGAFAGEHSTTVTGLSADGSTAFGTADLWPAGTSFRWRADMGLQPLKYPPKIWPTQVNAISGNGEWVVGGYNGMALRWGLDGQPLSLGTLPGSPPRTGYAATAINGDGTVIAGYHGAASAVPGQYSTKAFSWTQAKGIQTLAGFGTPWRVVYPTALNTDGTVLIGSGHFVPDGLTFPFNIRAFKWTEATGAVDIGSLAGSKYAHAEALSDDGQVIVGWSGYGQGFWEHACRWSPESGLQDLGMLPEHYRSFAEDVRGDGAAVVGMSIPPFDYERAFYWSAETGLVDLNVLLPSLGIDTGDWLFRWATGISADGRWITGTGNFHNQYRSWLVRLPG